MKLSPYFVLPFVFISSAYAQLTNQETNSPAAESLTTPNNATKCYQCNSANNWEADCDSGDKNVLKKYIIVCPKNQGQTYGGREATSCRKVLQDIVGENSVVRECAYSGNKTVDGKSHSGSKDITLTIYQCFNKENKEPCNSTADFKVNFFAQLASFFLFVLAIKLKIGIFH
ncbi:hypothetical protein Ddc_14170 [Ditylenchus destructor]|nr:hypothetical protein Ddc_14170 [Ditylenchus destructor]